MPKPRNPENKGLPSRWQKRHNAYYYQVPPGRESLWEGKKLFRLGSTLPEAYRAWSSRLEELDTARTVEQLADRYTLEHVTTLSPKTQESYRPAIARIRAVFGNMDTIDIEPHHCNTYFDRVKRKHSLATARTDIGVLRSMLSQGLRWGIIRSHPMAGLRFERLAAATDEVHQWQIDAMLSIEPDTRAVLVGQLYTRLKLMLGLRRGDMLRLQFSDFDSEGLRVTLHMTQHTSGVRLFVPFNDPESGETFDEFITLLEEIKAIPPKRSGSRYLFCTQGGEGFIDEETGRADGFDSLWRRFMSKVIEQTEVATRIKEKSLRAFMADESGTLEQAAHRLGQSNTATTERHYRKRPRVVLPLRPSGANETTIP
ncbi:tyrosine-type recombinase/integrase [Granulosicoccus sp. 3-233]|uniref:tyrosine-type recombinase/integrase n=1 Tax=Granulosicoccus sp. 3-233 TaxID=3417969 RepID=UPI003D34A499